MSIFTFGEEAQDAGGKIYGVLCANAKRHPFREKTQKLKIKNQNCGVAAKRQRLGSRGAGALP